MFIQYLPHVTSILSSDEVYAEKWSESKKHVQGDMYVMVEPNHNREFQIALVNVCSEPWLTLRLIFSSASINVYSKPQLTLKLKLSLALVYVCSKPGLTLILVV